MALPPNASTANLNSNSDITALQAIANMQFINQSAQAIANAISQGLFFCVLTTFQNCNLVNLINYYHGIGYQVVLPDVHYQVAGDNAPYSFFGVDYYDWLTNSYVFAQLTNPVRMRISWVLPTSGGIQVGPFISTQTANYMMSQNNEQVFADTTNGPFNINLPPTPVDGWVETISKVSVDSNVLSINGNGNNINGASTPITLVLENFSYSLIFLTGYGWSVFPQSTT